MTSFLRRVTGAALLDSRVYEEVEADRGATGQAAAVVVLSAVAGGIGLLGLDSANAPSLVGGVVSSLAGWIAWAMLTYLIGTRLLPERQTRADAGELLRTIAFASAPGLLRVLGIVPVAGLVLYAAASIWMLVAMIVAVRQALDYTSTFRAFAVVLIGWLFFVTISWALRA